MLFNFQLLKVFLIILAVMTTGFFIYVKRNFYNVALFEAIQRNKGKIVRKLIEKGVDINQNMKMSKSNHNAVQKAAYGGHCDAFKAILESGKADLSVINNSGRNLLQYSIINDLEDIASLILEYKNPEVVEKFIKDVDPQGHPPLLLALMHKRTQIVQDLLDAGAEVDHRSANGITPLEYIIQSANEESWKTKSNAEDEDESDSDTENVNKNIKNFLLIIENIKDCSEKLELARSYAKGKCADKITEYISKNERNDLTLKNMELFFGNEYSKTGSIISQIEYYFDRLEYIKKRKMEILTPRIENLIETLFKEGNYNQFFDLIYSFKDDESKFIRILEFFDEDSKKLSIFSFIEFVEFIYNSNKRPKLIDLVEEYSYDSILTCSFVCVALKYNDENDTVFAYELLKDYEIKISKVVGILLAGLEKDFVLYMSSRLKSILSENLELEGAKYLLNLVEQKNDDSCILPTFLISGEVKIASVIIKTINSEIVLPEGSLRQEMINASIAMMSKASNAELAIIFKFFKMLPNDQADVYETNKFAEEASRIFTIYDFDLIRDKGKNDSKYQLSLTFKSSPEQVALGVPAFIIYKLKEIEIKFLLKMIQDFVFDSSAVFYDFLKKCVDVGVEDLVERKAFRPENVQFVLESDEIIGLLQENDIELKFKAAHLDKIMIEHLPAKLENKPVFKVPKHLQTVLSDDINAWNSLELLTGKSIDKIALRYLIPKINERPRLYLGMRNAFIYWKNGPNRDSMKKIKSYIMKKMLIADFPELRQIFESETASA